jgi:hypothetical protein
MQHRVAHCWLLHVVAMACCAVATSQHHPLQASSALLLPLQWLMAVARSMAAAPLLQLWAAAIAPATSTTAA